jgi:NADH:ubiquinone oxidoreductase subunit
MALAPYSPPESWQRFGMLFSWWKSQTLGTWLHTKLSGNAVGTDDFGNRYFQNKDGSRRWVIYNGTVEASRVPPDWHGWLHHTYAEPPTRAPLKARAFEQPHQPNLTGTEGAYKPGGSLSKGGARPPATGDYQAWKPD